MSCTFPTGTAVESLQNKSSNEACISIYESKQLDPFWHDSKFKAKYHKVQQTFASLLGS